MMARNWTVIALGAAFVAMQAMAPGASAKELQVLSEKSVTGFGYPESVAYDPAEKVLYVGDFVSALKPAEKDGKGRINKVSLDGKILEKGIFPANGETMNKPKGIWIRGRHLWVADIDSLWEFDLKTKNGKRLALPGIIYANDVTIMGRAIYVSDNRADKVARVEPIDFLNAKAEPKVSIVYSGKGIFPNGLYPGKHGALISQGYHAKDKPHAIYELTPDKAPKQLSDNIGMLDGLYRMKNGDMIATDWVSGSLFQWDKKTGVHKLAEGFKGPADLCVIPNAKGYLVIVPDLVNRELRFVQLGK
jgi:hypothetical protein